MAGLASLNPISMGLGVVAGAVEIGVGLHQEKQAKKELARLHRPFYQIQSEFEQNKNIAEELAGQGLPSATKDYLTRETERGLGTGIKGILESGGSPNDISKLFDVFDSSVSRESATDAEMRLQNIQNFMGFNRELAGEKKIQFGLNELQPYESALENLQKRREAAQQNIWGGVQTMVGGASALGTSMQNQQLINQFNTPKKDFYSTMFGGGTREAIPTTPITPAISTSLQDPSKIYGSTPFYDAGLISNLLNKPQ